MRKSCFSEVNRAKSLFEQGYLESDLDGGEFWLVFPSHAFQFMIVKIGNSLACIVRFFFRRSF